MVVVEGSTTFSINSPPPTFASPVLFYRDLRLCAPRIDYGGFYSTCFAGLYDPFIERLRPDDILVDGGANIGSLSLLAARRVKHVVAVEPDPVNYQYLIHNIRLNGARNISPIHAAISDSEGTGCFEGAGETGALSSVGRAVRTVTMSSLSAEPITAAKLDIEGAEPLALADLSGLRSLRTLVYEVDIKALQRLSGRFSEKVEELDYKNLERRLIAFGFHLATLRSKGRIRVGRILSPELLVSEFRTRFFGARFMVSELALRRVNPLRPDAVSDMDMVYATR